MSAKLEQLTKMQYILNKHLQQKKRINKQLKKTQTRLQNASKEVLIRRFQFEIQQLIKELTDTKGKILWAQRVIRDLNTQAHIKETKRIDPLDFAKETHNELVYYPFANLKKLVGTAG